MTLQQLNYTETQVTEAVCKHLNLSFHRISQHCRERHLVYGRHICMYMLRMHTRLTQKQIGELFDMDHSTVIHGVRAINRLLRVDPVVKNDIAVINKAIQQ